MSAANWSEVEGPPAGAGAALPSDAAAAPEVSNGGRDISPGCARDRSPLRSGLRLDDRSRRSKLRGTSSQSKSRSRSASRYRPFPGADDDEGKGGGGGGGGCGGCCGGANDSRPRSRPSLLKPRSRSREKENRDDLESDLLRREDEDEDEDDDVLPSRPLSFPPPPGSPPPPLLPPIKALNMVTGRGKVAMRSERNCSSEGGEHVHVGIGGSSSQV